MLTRLLLYFGLYVSLLLPVMGAQATVCQTQIQQVFATQSDAKKPPTTGWQPVTLPDRWENRWPHYSGSVWYRVDWTYICPKYETIDHDPIGLNIQFINMAGQVYLNQHLLWQDHALTEPLSRSWNTPRYWIVPENALQNGKNTLWVRVIGVKTQSSGLGKVEIGDVKFTYENHQQRVWQYRTLFLINLIFTATFGVICFTIWFFRRQEKAFGWFALGSLFWTLFLSNFLITEPIFSLTTLEVARLNLCFLVLYSVTNSIFSWRFSEAKFIGVERCLWAVVVFFFILLCSVTDDQLYWLLPLVFFAASGLFFANCIFYPFLALRSDNQEQYLLALCFILYFIAGLHDVYHLILNRQDFKILSPYAAPITAIFIAVILALRLSKNIQRIERFNIVQAETIRTVTDELRLSLTTQHHLEMHNLKLQERIQLSHDLHDGVGSSIVRSMILVDKSKEVISNRQFLSILKLLRDDLRQVIDSGSSSGGKVPETPQIWLAPLRYRFQQIFDDSDIDAQWIVPEKWLQLPSVLQCLTLLRVMEEALTNIMKHSDASQVYVQVQYRGVDHLHVDVQDNGRGFNQESIQKMGLTVGLKSMQARVEKMNGEIDITSQPGCTRIHLVLKL